MTETDVTTVDPFDDLTEMPRDELESGLKVLGAPSFVRKGFPLLGLLATVYEHVSTTVGPQGANVPEVVEEVQDANDDADHGDTD